MVLFVYFYFCEFLGLSLILGLCGGYSTLVKFGLLLNQIYFVVISLWQFWVFVALLKGLNFGLGSLVCF